MNTIDNLMALAMKAANAELAWDIASGKYPHDKQIHGVDESIEALRTALTEALAPQPVREPLTIQHLREIERNHVYNHTATLIEFARRIERYHGIGGDK